MCSILIWENVNDRVFCNAVFNYKANTPKYHVTFKPNN